MSGAIPFGRMSLHVSTGSRAECFIYEDEMPILDISAGSALVAVCFAGGVADDGAVTFARELVRSAEQFAAQVERLHSEQSEIKADDGKAA